jgi:putative Ca2+/H+ antiporter (TMEM165/GDT1 family)
MNGSTHMGTTTSESIAASCSYCGLENSERLAACSGCGTSLASVPTDIDSEPKSKSKVLAVLLAFVFGPLGLFYATVSGGLIMIIIAVPLYLITRGGLYFSVAGRVICAVWAFVAFHEQDEASKSRREAVRLLDEAARLESSDRAKAITTYQEIVRLFPNTAASREAEQNIQTLTRQTHDAAA